MTNARARLSRDQWIDAAFEALISYGPGAVAVEKVARTLGSTKGSFYWHFANRDELLQAALDRWEVLATERLISSVEASGEPAEVRLRRLVDAVTTGLAGRRAELELLAGIDHPVVSAAVRRVTERRVAYIVTLLVDLGMDRQKAKQRGVLAYSMYLGQMQLVHSVPDVVPGSGADAHVLADEFVSMVLAR
ncbi:TetR/AcrR family transcriptional regulator [Rhodococcus sp. IEGM 1318]|uniref:TetR/AcrR family transcriptional regulator n=1 Tax=Rhodococcus sp. IEGM 1318 TaxID=3082226 RepID=UPI0029546ECF|nr:TetR/AcrR family transcriptional regulator [Rhodococcus sp. IEGM 1318]MDV8005852.1 TetR/AcrR family transcriptional regulator [Rhodococcus sp. IEGM 1318]